MSELSVRRLCVLSSGMLRAHLANLYTKDYTILTIVIIGRPLISKPLSILMSALLATVDKGTLDWTHIFPVSDSTLTSSGEIRSGLYSLLQVMVAAMRFLPSSGFHLAARINLSAHPGSESQRDSLG